GQHDNPGIVVFVPNPIDGFDAVEVRHLKIHERNVWSMQSKLFDRLLPVRRLSHELHIGLRVHECGNSLTEKRMIIDSQNPDQSRIGAHESSHSKQLQSCSSARWFVRDRGGHLELSL